MPSRHETQSSQTLRRGRKRFDSGDGDKSISNQEKRTKNIVGGGKVAPGDTHGQIKDAPQKRLDTCATPDRPTGIDLQPPPTPHSGTIPKNV